MPSPCYHGRQDSGVRLIVLHTAEGATTIESLGNFFSNYGNQVSSHTGADDKRGKIGEYVTRGNAAWTQANFNNAAVAMELCGFANWSRSTWLNQHENMLRNAADWIAEEAKKFGIPLTALNDSQAQGGGRGVCEHINLGAGGGGHVDCGGGFPMDQVMQWAKGGGAEAAPAEERTDPEMFYLRFALDPETGAINDDSTLVIPNEYADGKHRIRFGCRVTQTIRVDQSIGDTHELTLGYDRGAQGFTITEDCKFMVVHVDEPRTLGEPIAVCFSG